MSVAIPANPRINWNHSLTTGLTRCYPLSGGNLFEQKNLAARRNDDQSHASMTGTAARWGWGRWGQQVEWTGTQSSYYDCGEASELYGVTQATLAGRIRKATASNIVTFGRQASGSGGKRFNFVWYSDGVLYCSAEDTFNQYVYFTLPVGDYHFAMVYDGTLATWQEAMRLFIDGKQVEGLTQANSAPAASLYGSGGINGFEIGGNTYRSFYAANGVRTTDIRLWTRALRLQEVARLANCPGEMFLQDRTYIVEAPAASQTVTVLTATETDTAITITPSKGSSSATADPATETDTALSITPSLGTPLSATASPATETDTALHILANKGTDPMPAAVWAIETDVAVSITPSIMPLAPISVGTATETDVALSISVVADQTVTVGQALETDTALLVTPGLELAISVTPAVEVDTARMVTPNVGSGQTVGVTPAGEVDTALGVTITRHVPLGTAVETDTAPSVSVMISQTLYNMLPAVETDAALSITPTLGTPLSVTVGIALETDTARGVSYFDPTVVLIAWQAIGILSEAQLVGAETYEQAIEKLEAKQDIGAGWENL